MVGRRARRSPRAGSEVAIERTFYRLAEDPRETILIACSKCEWKAAYRRDELLAAHGPACPMPSLLNHLGAPGCPRLGSYWDRCGVHYIEPIAGGGGHRGRRSAVPLSDLRVVVGGLQEGKRCRAELPVGRLAGGIRQIQTGMAVFGATDVPLQIADLQRDALVQFPTVMGGVVVIVNIAGVKAGELTLDGSPGSSSARSGRGTIRRSSGSIRRSGCRHSQSWRCIDPDSATSYVLTHYLSKISSDWRMRVGANTAVQWPAGLGARGNDGVANTVAQTKGSIGYAEYAYARHNNLTFARLVNRDGRAVAPNAASLMAAARNANWEARPGFGVILTDTSGAESWPMASASFVVMRKRPDDPAAIREALKFFAWAFANGNRLAEQLLYAPMPDNVVGAIQRLWAAEIRDASGRPLLARPN